MRTIGKESNPVTTTGFFANVLYRIFAGLICRMHRRWMACPVSVKKSLTNKRSGPPSTAGGTRTRTTKGHWILNPKRLPIPPQPRVIHGSHKQYRCPMCGVNGKTEDLGISFHQSGKRLADH